MKSRQKKRIVTQAQENKEEEKFRENDIDSTFNTKSIEFSTFPSTPKRDEPLINRNLADNSHASQNDTDFPLSPTKLSYKINPYFNRQSFDIIKYLKIEMFGIGEPGNLEPIGNENNLKNFFYVPAQLELLVGFGIFLCFDSFLYVLTYLPIRVFLALILLIKDIFNRFFFGSSDNSFHRTQTYDLMRGATLLITVLILKQINMSQIYHLIRGQSMIKLYVLTSMMEVLDKLLSTFGQDCFDALHRQTRFNPKSVDMALTYLLVNTYVVIHSILYFFQIATLTVVINSADEALITVLILNNFAEIKSFVFKKFDSNNLFQLTCSDINERFQIILFLGLIVTIAVIQSTESIWESSFSYIKVCSFMVMGEVLADCIKHAFINKFNSIRPTSYDDFAYILRSDILSNQKDQVILDHTYSVTRRIGLSQIPLGCVCIRYLMLALNVSKVSNFVTSQSVFSLSLIILLSFFGLVLIKITLGLGLVSYSDKMQRSASERSNLYPVDLSTVPTTARKEEKDTKIAPKVLSEKFTEILQTEKEAEEAAILQRIEYMEDLAGIERYTIYKGRII